MRPTGHFSTSIIAIGILYYCNLILNPIYLFMFLIGNISIDFDIIFTQILKEKNHRRYLTHYLPFWVLISIIAYFVNLLIFFFSIGICYHLLFDWFDWGLPIIPHKQNSPLTPHLLKGHDKNLPESYFFY